MNAARITGYLDLVPVHAILGRHDVDMVDPFHVDLYVEVTTSSHEFSLSAHKTLRSERTSPIQPLSACKTLLAPTACTARSTEADFRSNPHRAQPWVMCVMPFGLRQGFSQTSRW